jgi:hypothetical protein
MKVQHAECHLGKLNDAIQSFFASHPYKCSGKPDLQARKVDYTMDSVEAVPEEIPLILGDIIQNLRSALDHAVYKLYLKGTGGSAISANIYFPIADSKQQYDHTKGSKTHGILPSDKAKVDALQPYKGGNDLLWVIHKLNNIDKHRLLLTVGSALHSIDYTAYIKQVAPQMMFAELDMPPIHLFPKEGIYPLKPGTVIFTDLTRTEPINPPPTTFNIVFDEPGISEGKAILPLMTEMVKAVKQIVADLS